MGHYYCSHCEQHYDWCMCAEKENAAAKVDLIGRIFAVSDEITASGQPRHPVPILTKTMEEIGELSTEIGIKYFGFYKEPGKDGIIGEAVDAINCLIDLIHVENPDITPEELCAMFDKKLAKWKKKAIGE